MAPMNKNYAAENHSPAFKKKEQSAREDGLQQALSTDNIGFKMLSKMGYKVGKLYFFVKCH